MDRRNSWTSGNVESTSSFDEEMDALINEIDHFEDLKKEKRSYSDGHKT